jgi:hypothetical protein
LDIESQDVAAAFSFLLHRLLDTVFGAGGARELGRIPGIAMNRARRSSRGFCNRT